MMKKILSTPLTGCLAITAATTGFTSAATVVYSEDFTSFITPGSSNRLNGAPEDLPWDDNIGDGLLVTTTGVVTGDGTDGASANFNAYSLPAGTTSVTVDFVTRARSGATFGALFVLTAGADNSSAFGQFGTAGSGFRIRNQTGGDFFSGNISGEDAVDGGHKFFDFRITYDFTTSSGTFQSSRSTDQRGVSGVAAGDGVYSTVATFTGADLGGNIDDPANWTGLYLRSGSTSNQYDNIVITAVPEPSSTALLGLGGLALILRRRR
ncbi:hypothetical protein NT6N_21470 [Oceaniferula spumae]|uniref:Ice-binding protein C-terminal domain-containing protein n=1 Tax=Oceaniferula spumae TaxID=2979115 RepID=A0AAT9FMB5_9BACT